MLAALLPPGGVGYQKMTDDTEAGWGRGGDGERQAGEEREVEREVMEGEEGQLKLSDGERGVGLSVPLCLLQPLPLLQHVM